MQFANSRRLPSLQGDAPSSEPPQRRHKEPFQKAGSAKCGAHLTWTLHLDEALKSMRQSEADGSVCGPFITLCLISEHSHMCHAGRMDHRQGDHGQC
eukprot:1140426-Pelagomonas_calceolata.AAC.1